MRKQIFVIALFFAALAAGAVAYAHNDAGNDALCDDATKNSFHYIYDCSDAQCADAGAVCEPMPTVAAFETIDDDCSRASRNGDCAPRASFGHHGKGHH